MCHSGFYQPCGNDHKRGERIVNFSFSNNACRQRCALTVLELIYLLLRRSILVSSLHHPQGSPDGDIKRYLMETCSGTTGIYTLDFFSLIHRVLDGCPAENGSFKSACFSTISTKRSLRLLAGWNSFYVHITGGSRYENQYSTSGLRINHIGVGRSIPDVLTTPMRIIQSGSFDRLTCKKLECFIYDIVETKILPSSNNVLKLSIQSVDK